MRSHARGHLARPRGRTSRRRRGPRVRVAGGSPRPDALHRRPPVDPARRSWCVASSPSRGSRSSSRSDRRSSRRDARPTGSLRGPTRSPCAGRGRSLPGAGAARARSRRNPPQAGGYTFEDHDQRASVRFASCEETQHRAPIVCEETAPSGRSATGFRRENATVRRDFRLHSDSRVTADSRGERSGVGDGAPRSAASQAGCRGPRRFKRRAERSGRWGPTERSEPGGVQGAPPIQEASGAEWAMGPHGAQRARRGAGGPADSRGERSGVGDGAPRSAAS